MQNIWHTNNKRHGVGWWWRRWSSDAVIHAVMDVNQQRVEQLHTSSVLPLMFPKYMRFNEKVECLQDDKTVCR